MFSLCNVCIFLFVFCLVFSNVNGSIRPNCADVLLRIYSPTHPRIKIGMRDEGLGLIVAVSK